MAAVVFGRMFGGCSGASQERFHSVSVWVAWQMLHALSSVPRIRGSFLGTI